MVGMSVELLDAIKTAREFGMDPEFQNLLKQTGVSPQCLKINYGAAASAGFTEMGGAADSEFIGAAFEKSTVLCDTRVNTPGGSYFYIYVIDAAGSITQYYVWFSKKEVFTVTTLAAASITTGTYFTYVDSEAAPTSYYVWMDKNGDGVTDDPGHATFTGVACNISAATTAADVATIVAAAINGLAGTVSGAVSDLVTVTMATKGDPTNAVDVDTTFVITVTENGGADPSASGTGAECDIKAATTDANVATIVQGIINALADVTAGVSTATVTITNDVIGLVTKTTDGNTGFTITQVEQSASNHEGAPLYQVSASGDDTDLATKDVRKLQHIGYTKETTGKIVLRALETAMGGTVQQKTSTVNWIRVIHSKAIDWGSAGADAKAAISIENVDGTDFLTILITTNESKGGIIWLPNHIHAKIAEVELRIHDIAIAADRDGAMVQFVKYGLDETKNNRGNIDPDHPNIPFIVTVETPHIRLKYPHRGELHGTDVGKLTIQEALVNTTVNFVFTAYILIWYKANS